nr:MAG TPA: hypothetical protein [Caudoviricetes sp.]
MLSFCSWLNCLKASSISLSSLSACIFSPF